MARALEEPLKQIAVNAGLEGGVIVEKVRSLKGANGLNAATGEYEDLVKAGVIDAAKVTRSALQNAASIAALFLTTEAVIADKPEPKGAGGGMPRRHARHGWHGRLLVTRPAPPRQRFDISTARRVASAGAPFAFACRRYPSTRWSLVRAVDRVGCPPPLLPSRPRPRGARSAGAAKRIARRGASLEADGHQALVFAVLGHKADLGVMALGPDLARLQAFQHELAATPLVLVDSYVSLTELSEYTVDRGRRARPARGRGGPRGPGSRGPARRVARAHRRTTTSSASTRSCR